MSKVRRQTATWSCWITCFIVDHIWGLQLTNAPSHANLIVSGAVLSSSKWSTLDAVVQVVAGWSH